MTNYHWIPSDPPSHDFQVDCMGCKSDWTFEHDPFHVMDKDKDKDKDKEFFTESNTSTDKDDDPHYCLQCKHFVDTDGVIREDYKSAKAAAKSAANAAKKAEKSAAKAVKKAVKSVKAKKAANKALVKACGKCVKCPKCKVCCPKCKCKMCSPLQYAYKVGGYMFLGTILFFLFMNIFILVYTLIIDGPADLIVKDLERRILDAVLPSMDKSQRRGLKPLPAPGARK